MYLNKTYTSKFNKSYLKFDSSLTVFYDYLYFVNNGFMFRKSLLQGKKDKNDD